MRENQRDNDTDRYELSTWLNPGKSQGRPNENPGLEAHRSNYGLPVCVLPIKGPCPGCGRTYGQHRTDLDKQFHASRSSSANGRSPLGVKRLGPTGRDVRRKTEVNRDLLYETDEYLKRDAQFPPLRGCAETASAP